MAFGSVCAHDDYYSFRECPINIADKRKYILEGENKNIFTKKGINGSFSGTICENKLDLSTEEHKWKIKILKTKSNRIYVGVAPIDFDFYFKTLNIDTCGWYLRIDDVKLYSGPPFKYNGLKTNLSKVGDEIIIVMNMKKKTLKYIINNEDKGDSYTDIPIDKPLFPAVCLLDIDDSIEINQI